MVKVLSKEASSVSVEVPIDSLTHLKIQSLVHEVK